jgi:hypothetical protein
MVVDFNANAFNSELVTSSSNIDFSWCTAGALGSFVRMMLIHAVFNYSN